VPSHDWTTGEPGLAEAGHEVVRLFDRARRHPRAVVVLALLVGGAFAAWRATHRPRPWATVVLSVTEGDLDPTTAPRPQRQLRHYVEDVIFSRPNLLAIAKQNQLVSAERLATDPLRAYDNVRDDIEVEVYRNYFLEDRGERSAARSARIVIRYCNKDRDVAMTVANMLAQLLIERESESRRDEAKQALEMARMGVSELSADIEAKRKELYLSELEANRPGQPRDVAMRATVAASRLRSEIVALDGRLTIVRKEANDLELRSAIERGQLGLVFQLVDTRRDPAPPSRRAPMLIVSGFAVALFALPFCGLFLGALDNRIYNSEDVRRLGLTSLGSVTRQEEHHV